MKYHEFYNKEQETKGHLLTDMFGNILGVGLYTLVVKPLPKMITDIISCKRLTMIVRFIFKKPNDVVIRFNYISSKVCVS